MKQIVLFTTLTSSLALLNGCTKSKDSTTTSSTPADLGDGKEGFAVVGKLELGTLLTAAAKVTHVVALNTESGRKLAFPVDADTGEFRLVLPTASENDFTIYIKDDGSLNREKLLKQHPEAAADIEGKSDAEVITMINEGASETAEASLEPSPWTLAYIDSSKVGAEMIISRFAAETLDTLSPTRGNVGLDIGEVTPQLGDKASSTTSYADILKSVDMSEATATTFGAIDDVSLRYINPDIDADGVLDAPVVDAEGVITGTAVNYTLDFHNRFNVAGADGAVVMHTSLKNKFADDVVGLANLTVTYTGTGITPELEKSTFSAAPSSYKWKFEADITVPSSLCSELPAGGTIAAGTWCTQSYTENTSYDRYQLGQQLATPPEGTYVLDAGGKVFTWTDVKVSDFGAGTGFVILLVKYETGDNGTADTSDDVLSGISYKYLKKTSAGWVAATEDELKLLIKGDGGTLSLKFDNNSLNCGVTIPKTPSGTIAVSSANFQENSSSAAVTTLITELKAGTVLWSRFSSGAASYDDKLGMCFFF